jgi:hypothetical protein
MSWTGEWHNHSLACLQDCGERFRRRFIEGEWMPPNLRMVRGSVLARVASKAMMRKMRKEATPTWEEARDMAATEFTAAEKAGIMYSDEDLEVGPAKARGEAKDFAVDISGLYVNRIVPIVNPVGVERRIRVKPRDSDIEIVGTIDLIDAHPDGEVIRDQKSSAKSPNKNAAHDSQQLSIYTMIRLAEVGTLPAWLALDFLVRTPERKELKYVPLRTSRTVEDVQAMVARINTAVEAVKKGIFVPANPEAWYCSKAYCEYWTTCPYVAAGRARPTS